VSSLASPGVVGPGVVGPGSTGLRARWTRRPARGTSGSPTP
jgi:hypothetical protein